MPWASPFIVDGSLTRRLRLNLIGALAIAAGRNDAELLLREFLSLTHICVMCYP